MFKFLGFLIFFMILFVDDFYWCELGMLLKNVNYEFVKFYNNFLDDMRKDLLLILIYFEKRFNVLMKNIVLLGK